MLAKSPDERYQDMLRVQHDLRCVQKGEPLSLADANGKKSLFKIYLGIILGIAAVVVLVVAYYFQSSAKPAVPQRTPDFKVGVPMPTLESMRADSTARKNDYFSEPVKGNQQTRLFHFPAQTVGNIGSGIFARSLVPAVGDMTLQIPLSFSTTDSSAVSGFRNNEVGSVFLRGVLIDDMAIERIKQWRELVQLDIAGTDIGDQSIKILQTFPKLVGLSVGGTRISVTGLRQLQLEKMRSLNVDHIPFASELLPKLRHNQLMYKLSMAGTGLKDSDLKIMSTMTKITLLDVRDNDFSDAGLKNLVSFNYLTNLFIASKKLTPRCIETFKRCLAFVDWQSPRITGPHKSKQHSCVG